MDGRPSSGKHELEAEFVGRMGGVRTRADVDPTESVLSEGDVARLPKGMLAEIQAMAAAQAREPARVVDRLRRHRDHWRIIARDDPYVLDMVENGYKCPIVGKVTPRRYRNHPGCFETPEHTAFVRKAVGDLLAVGAAREVDPSFPTIISPLNVAFKKGAKKFRLILDMRWFNQFIWYEKFRFELHRREGREIFLPEWLMAALDLAAAYYHVWLCEEDQKYFGLKFEDKTLVMCVLPFGYVDAPRAFTRILRPSVRALRRLGLRIMQYLDDYIWANARFQGSMADTMTVLREFVAGGWLIAWGKCSFFPEMEKESLGVLINTRRRLGGMATGAFVMPEPRRLKFLARVRRLRDMRRAPVKDVARVAGDAVSSSLSLGFIARLLTRRMYALIETRYSWNSYVTITADVAAELDAWLTGPAWFWEGQPIARLGRTVLVDGHLWTDASDFASGGCLLLLDKDDPAQQGAWHFCRSDLLTSERELSSMVRELLGVLRALRSYPRGGAPGSIDGLEIAVHMDNQGAVFVCGGHVPGFDGVYGGSAKVAAQEIAELIFRELLERRCRAHFTWVPREGNVPADYMSKVRDMSDWALLDVWVRALGRRHGEHTVDRFANEANVVVRSGRFWSRFWCPGTEGVDAFTVSWAGDNNWVNPPFFLIGDVIRHLRWCRAVATVIIPVREWAPWWPLVCPDGAHWAPFITDAVELPSNTVLFTAGGSTGAVESHPPRFRVMALRVDFRERPERIAGRRAMCSRVHGDCSCGGDRWFLRPW